MTSSHPFLEWIFMRRIPWSGLQIWCAGVKNGGLCWDVGWKMSNEHGCVIFGWPSMKGSLHSLWLGYFQQSPSNFPDLHRWMWSQQDPFSECKPWAKCEEVSEISMGKTAFSCLWKGGMRVISPLLCFHDPMSHMARGVSPHLAEWGSYLVFAKSMPLKRDAWFIDSKFDYTMKTPKIGTEPGHARDYEAVWAQRGWLDSACILLIVWPISMEG